MLSIGWGALVLSSSYDISVTKICMRAAIGRLKKGHKKMFLFEIRIRYCCKTVWLEPEKAASRQPITWIQPPGWPDPSVLSGSASFMIRLHRRLLQVDSNFSRTSGILWSSSGTLAARRLNALKDVSHWGPFFFKSLIMWLQVFFFIVKPETSETSFVPLPLSSSALLPLIRGRGVGKPLVK